MDPNKTVRMPDDSNDLQGGDRDQLDKTVQMRHQEVNDSQDLPRAPTYHGVESFRADFSIDTLDSQTFEGIELPYQLGPYVLVEKIGSGGASIVYRATTEDGADVAIKLLRPNVITSELVLKRFQKESRLHEQLNSPFVAQHKGFGQIDNRYFLASEFVQGEQLGSLISTLIKSRNFDLVKSLGLLIIRDLLRGLSELHKNGIVHRDIKPENAIVVWKDPNNAEITVQGYRQTKLIDFGLARALNQSESMAITQQKILLGTPLYMAPEQYTESRSVDARCDVYSVGVTLYHLLAGKPPFSGEQANQLAEQHRLEIPRPLASLNRGIGPALSNIVAKALEKEPAMRYADAAEMLADIENVIHHRPISVRPSHAYPELARKKTKQYDFEWTLDATPEQLWPLVADTNRFNKALGLPLPRFQIEHGSGERKIFANAKFMGASVKWREYPFQWVRLRELSVLRVFETGPFETVSSTVVLSALADRRTRINHRFEVVPRGIFGKMLTPLQFGYLTKGSLNRIYKRLEIIAGQSNDEFSCDMPFGKPVKLSSRQSNLLSSRIDKIITDFAHPLLVEKFSDALRSISDSSAGHIQPIRLVRQLGCSDDEALELCCRAVENSVLQLTWDVICPVCRVSAQTEGSLKHIRQHAHCEYCNLDFKLNFAESIELIFKIHPDIRHIDSGKYCIGGPFHAPHVIAQNRVTAKEQIEFATPLVSGEYVIKSSGHEDAVHFRTSKHSNESVCRINLGQPQNRVDKLNFSTKEFSDRMLCMKLKNSTEVDIWSRLELESRRRDAMTAAMAAMHPLFSKMFPNEVVRPEQLIEKSNRYLLCAQILDFDNLVQSVGEVAIQQNWATFSDLWLAEAHDKANRMMVGDTAAVFVFDTLAELVNGFERYCQLYPESLLVRRNNYGLAIGFGEIINSDSGNRRVFFGPAIRAVQKLATNLLTLDGVPEPVVVPEQLLEIVKLHQLHTLWLDVPGHSVDDHLLFQIKRNQ
jgi:eukaryotic-like serine/threonine-protein kinase